MLAYSCRNGYIEAATLSSLLKQHTAAELYDKLQSLIDYLLLAGPVSKYLPIRKEVPLMHASVLGLHVQAAADAAVQAMLSSTGFSSPNYTQDFSTAVFYLSITLDNTSGVKIQPYAVSGAGIKWKQHTIKAAGPTAAQIDYVRVDPSVTLSQLPEGGPSSTLDLYSLPGWQAAWLAANERNSSESTIRANYKILPVVETRLKSALAACSTTEHNPKVEVVPCHAHSTTNKNVLVLVVHW